VATQRNETDFDEIESDMRQLCSRFNVVSAGYDPWQSAQISQQLRGEGVPMHEFRATTQNFSPAIIELDAAMRSTRLRHDGNPVLTWCIGNAVGKADRRGNLYPTKARPDQKIDAAVALMMAMGRAMVEDEQAKGAGWFSRKYDLWIMIAPRNTCECPNTAAGLLLPICHPLLGRTLASGSDGRRRWR
jgi:phage terminase large subunit-like protein